MVRSGTEGSFSEKVENKGQRLKKAEKVMNKSVVN